MREMAVEWRSSYKTHRVLSGIVAPTPWNPAGSAIPGNERPPRSRRMSNYYTLVGGSQRVGRKLLRVARHGYIAVRGDLARRKGRPVTEVTGLLVFMPQIPNLGY
jgi:hypothetical protein